MGVESTTTGHAALLELRTSEHHLVHGLAHLAPIFGNVTLLVARSEIGFGHSHHILNIVGLSRRLS